MMFGPTSGPLVPAKSSWTLNWSTVTSATTRAIAARRTRAVGPAVGEPGFVEPVVRLHARPVGLGLHGEVERQRDRRLALGELRAAAHAVADDARLIGVFEYDFLHRRPEAGRKVHAGSADVVESERGQLDLGFACALLAPLM